MILKKQSRRVKRLSDCSSIKSELFKERHGKNFDLAISALEKQIPKKVTYDYGLNETRCPECKTIFGYAEEGEDDEYYAPYCYECGQCLDWEEENE